MYILQECIAVKSFKKADLLLSKTKLKTLRHFLFPPSFLLWSIVKYSSNTPSQSLPFARKTYVIDLNVLDIAAFHCK
jgi:hypothetical protein